MTGRNNNNNNNNKLQHITWFFNVVVVNFAWVITTRMLYTLPHLVSLTKHHLQVKVGISMDIHASMFISLDGIHAFYISYASPLFPRGAQRK